MVFQVTSTSNLPWVDPGAFEIAPSVFRVPLRLPNDGLRAVNVYVIVTDVGVVCIDAGWAIPESKALLGEALASLGFTLADITRFLVTHCTVTTPTSYGSAPRLTTHDTEGAKGNRRRPDRGPRRRPRAAARWCPSPGAGLRRH